MRILNMMRWRVPLSFYLIVGLPVQNLATPLPAQTTSAEIVYTGPDEYQVTRPMACPLEMKSFLGFLFGYQYAGHEWTDQWRRNRILDPVNQALAEYVPPGDPYYIVARDGEARWYDPRLTVRCTVTEWWSRGRIVLARDSYKVIAHGGTVVECGSGGGAIGGTELMPVTMEPYSTEFDPYASSDSYAGDGGACGGDSEAGTDGGTGSGTQYKPGDSTGGETVDWGSGEGNGGTSACGDRAIVEYACIDIWVEGVGWQEWGCGYVTTC